MLNAWTSLAAGHDQTQLLVAALVCLTGLFLSLRLFSRALAGGPEQGGWVAISAIGAGGAIWAGHFLAMTAYQPDLASGYDPVRTIFAFMAALAGMTAALWAAAGPRQPWRAAMAGGLFGIGVTAALSASVNAFQAQAALSWQPLQLLLATPVAVLLACMAFTFGGDLRTAGRQFTAAVLLFASAAMVHLGGVHGISLLAQPGAILPSHLIAPGILAIAVVLAAGLTLGGGFAAMGFTDCRARAVDQTRLREIIDALPEAVAYCDSGDRMTFWNARYDQLGRQSGMRLAMGRPFRDLVQDVLSKDGYAGAKGREHAWLTERMSRHTAGHALYEHALNDGRWLRIEESRTSDGGIVMVCVDITELKQSAQILADARDEAQRINRAKSEFLANMSHEIRTPLNGVIGLADVLARTQLDAKQREIVDIVRSSGVTLERLLSDVLDLARIESGRLEIRHEAFHLGDMVRQAAGLAETRARNGGVAFKLEIDPAAEVEVEGDPDRIKQVLLNLLGNAVKFTSEGHVALSVGKVAGETGSMFRFQVADTGVGFSMEDKSRLFQRFEQADGSITRRYGGSGLGLAIAYQLAVLMGGTIDADAVQGEGATFVVDLPLPLAGAAKPASTRADAAPDRPAGFAPRVLIAEDHPTNLKVVELMLQTIGAHMTTVENGAEAVGAFRAGRFDVILMDIQMPVMDGLRAIEAIRQIEHRTGAARTPIIAVTANALPEHVRASAAAGADAHLAKPITASTLIPTIDRLIQMASAPQAATTDRGGARAA